MFVNKVLAHNIWQQKNSIPKPKWRYKIYFCKCRIFVLFSGVFRYSTNMSALFPYPHESVYLGYLRCRPFFSQPKLAWTSAMLGNQRYSAMSSSITLASKQIAAFCQRDLKDPKNWQSSDQTKAPGDTSYYIVGGWTQPHLKNMLVKLGFFPRDPGWK